MNELSQFVTLIIQAVIAFALPVLAAALAKYVIAQADRIKHSLSTEQYGMFVGLVGMVVNAAEQSGLVGLIKNTGEAKKKWAIDTLQQIVASRGLNIPLAQIEAEIEDAVRRGVHLPETDQAVDVRGVPLELSPEEETDLKSKFRIGLIPADTPNSYSVGLK